MLNLSKDQFYNIIALQAQYQRDNPKNSCAITLANIFDAVSKKTGKKYHVKPGMQIKPDCPLFGLAFGGAGDHLVTFFKNGQSWIMVQSWQNILALGTWITVDIEAIGNQIAEKQLTPFTNIQDYVHLYILQWTKRMTVEDNDAIQGCKKMFNSKAIFKQITQSIWFD